MTVNPKISFFYVKTRFLDEGQSCRPQEAYQSKKRRVTGMRRPRGCIVKAFFMSQIRCSYGTDLATISRRDRCGTALMKCPITSRAALRRFALICSPDYLLGLTLYSSLSVKKRKEGRQLTCVRGIAVHILRPKIAGW